MTTQSGGFINMINGWGEAYWDFAAAMFVQVSVLVVLLLCLDVVLLRRVRAAVRYGVWSLVLVKLLLPISLSSPVSVSRWLPDFPLYPRETSPSRTEPFREAVRPDRPLVVESASTDVVPSVAVSERNDPAIKPRETESAFASGPATFDSSKTDLARSQPAVHTRVPPVHWKAYVLLTWSAVVSVLTVLLARRALLVRRIVAQSAAAPVELVSVLAECRRLAGVSGKRVRLRVSDDLGSPAICGFWRGTILLPRPLLEKLDLQQMRLVLVHELIHWRRCDLQVNSLQTVLQIAYFYNPLVWVANTMLRRSREQAVDESVLATLKFPAQQYSSTLLDIASISRRRAELAMRLIGVIESRKALAGRIRRILTRAAPKRPRLGLTGLGIVLLSGLVLLPMARNSEQQVIAEETGNGAFRLLPVSGRIVDTQGRPVPDAEVSLRKTVRGTMSGRIRPGTNDLARTTSDSEGRFRFADVAAGEDNLRVDVVAVAEGHAVGWKHLPGGVTRENVRIVLAPESRLGGRVVNDPVGR